MQSYIQMCRDIMFGKTFKKSYEQNCVLIQVKEPHAQNKVLLRHVGFFFFSLCFKIIFWPGSQISEQQSMCHRWLVSPLQSIRHTDRSCLHQQCYLPLLMFICARSFFFLPRICVSDDRSSILDLRGITNYLNVQLNYSQMCFSH